MKALRILLVTALLLPCASCVEFDKQTLSYRYDPHQDQLLIFQVYERIHGDGEIIDGEIIKITKHEREQLTSVVDGQKTYFSLNRILEFNRELIEEFVGELKKELEELERVSNAPNDLREADPAEANVMSANLDLLEKLLDSVRIQNGQFYVNEEQELCAYQAVVVSDVSRLIEKANRLINLALKADELLSDQTKLTQEQKQKIKQFVDHDGHWIERDGNRLTFQFVHTYQDHMRMRKSLAKMIRDGTKTGFADLLEMDVFFSFDEPFAQVQLGRGDILPTEITGGILNKYSSPYNSKLLGYVRKKYPVAEKPDLARIRDEFFRTGKLTLAAPK